LSFEQGKYEEVGKGTFQWVVDANQKALFIRSYKPRHPAAGTNCRGIGLAERPFSGNRMFFCHFKAQASWNDDGYALLKVAAIHGSFYWFLRNGPISLTAGSWFLPGQMEAY
jgi:hypothetical protein